MTRDSRTVPVPGEKTNGAHRRPPSDRSSRSGPESHTCLRFVRNAAGHCEGALKPLEFPGS